MKDDAQTKAFVLYFSGHAKCAPCHSFGPGIRTQYLLHVVLCGKGKVCIAGQVHELKADSLFFIQPGQMVYYEADQQTPWEYCWIGFGGSDMKHLLETCNLLTQSVHKDLPQAARSTFVKLCRDHIENRGNELWYKGLFYQFFSYLAPGPDVLPPAGRYLKKATEYIQQNFMHDISISAISDDIGINRSYLYRLFYQWQNTSPQQYLLHCRIDAARKMLLETDYPQTENKSQFHTAA